MSVATNRYAIKLLRTKLEGAGKSKYGFNDDALSEASKNFYGVRESQVVGPTALLFLQLIRGSPG